MSYSNKSTITTIDTDGEYMFVTYYPFTLIIVGTLLNSFTFFILCRPTFQDTNRRPTIHYMRAVAIFDILMLYGWNLDHYLYGAHGFTLQLYSIPSCRIFSFLDYFAPQVSAWLCFFICLDRYLSLSRPHKTWFSQSKNVLIIIASIVTIFTIINFQFFIFACYYMPDGTINTNSSLYIIYPLWDMMNLGLYNCAPFIFMVIFNSGVIYHLIRLRQKSTVQNSKIKHRSIYTTLVITTFLFSIMTIPSTGGYAFFQDTTSDVILHSFDSMLYKYHVLSFPLYMITFTEFREEVFLLVTINMHHRIEPTTIRLTERTK